MHSRCRRLLIVAIAWAIAVLAYADLCITLKRAFVEQLKNRATIEDVTFTIDHALDHAKSVGKGSNDGDIHISGRSPKVGLPMVAKVINARV